MSGQRRGQGKEEKKLQVVWLGQKLCAVVYRCLVILSGFSVILVIFSVVVIVVFGGF